MWPYLAAINTADSFFFVLWSLLALYLSSNLNERYAWEETALKNGVKPS